MNKHPYASPLYASTFEDLPPILIQYGSKEVMSDEIRSLVKKLKNCQNTIFRSEEYEVGITDFVTRYKHAYDIDLL